MGDPTLMILGERRRRGRPPANEPSSSVSTWLPVSVHDRLISVASAREISVSELVRQAIVITIQAPVKQRKAG